MALKNRDLTFVIKVQNSARAALRALRGDLTETGKAGRGMASDLQKAQAAIDKLKTGAAGAKALAQGIDGVAASSRRAKAAAEDEGAARKRIADMVARSLEGQARAQQVVNNLGGLAGSRAQATASTNAMRGTTPPPRTPTGAGSSGAAGAAAMRATTAAAGQARTAVTQLTAADNILTRAFDFTRDAVNHLGTRITAAFGGTQQGLINGMLSRLRQFGPTVGATVASFAAFAVAAKAVQAISGSITGSIAAFARFDKSIAQTRAVAQGTVESIRPLREGALQLGATTEFGATQAADALTKLIQNGLTAQQALASLRPAANLATVGQIDLAEAADSLTKILAQYGLGVEDAARATDVLNFVNVKSNTDIKQLSVAMAYAGTVAKAFGLSLNETAAAIGVLGNAGIQGSAAGTAIRAVLLDLVELSSGSAPKKALEVFKNLKIDPKNIDPGRVSLAKALEEFKKAGASRADLNTLFQKRGVTPVLSLLNQTDKDTGENSLTKLTRESKSAGGFNAQQAEEARRNLLTQYEKLKGAVEVAGIRLIEGSVGRALGSAVEFLTALANAFSGVVDPTNRMTGAVQIFNEALRGIAAAAAIYFLGFRTMASGNTIFTASLALLRREMNLTGAFNALRAGAASAVGALRGLTAAGAVNGLKGLASGFVSAGAAAAKFALGLLANPLGPFLIAITAIVALMAIFSDRTVDLNGRTVALGDILSTVFDRIKAVAGQVASFLAGLVNSVLGFFGATDEAGGNTAQGLYDNFKRVVNFVIGLFIGLSKSVGVILANILTPFVALGKAASAAIEGDFKAAGAAAMIGLKQGAKNAVGVGLFAGVGKEFGGAFGKDYVGGFVDGIVRDASIKTNRRRIDAAQARLAGGAKGNGIVAGTEFDAGAADGINHGGGAENAARRSGRRAAEAFASTIKKLQDKFDPQTGLERQYKEDLDNLAKAATFSDAALKNLGISREDLTRIQAGAARQFARDTDFLYENNRAIDDQLKLLTTSRDMREIETEVLAVQNKAIDKNRELTEAQTTALRNRLIVQQAAKALDAARGTVSDAARDLNMELSVENQLGTTRSNTLEVMKQVDALRRAGVTDEAKIKEIADAYNLVLEQRALLQARDNLRDTLGDLEGEIRLSGVLYDQQEKVRTLLQFQSQLRRDGVKDQGEINRLTDLYAEALDRVAAAQNRAKNDAVGGLREGLRDVAAQFNDLRSSMRGLITDTFTSLSDNLQNFLKGGKFSLKSVMQTLSGSLIKTGVDGLLGQAAGALDGLFGKKGTQPGATGPLGDLIGNITGKGAGADPATKAGLKLAQDLATAYTQTTTGVGTVGNQFVNGLQTTLNGILASVAAVQPGAPAGAFNVGSLLSTGVGGGTAAIGGALPGLLGGGAGGAAGGGLLEGALNILKGGAQGGDATGGSGLLAGATSILQGTTAATGGGGLLDIAGSILGGSGAAGGGGLMGLISGILGGGGLGGGGAGGLGSLVGGLLGKLIGGKKGSGIGSLLGGLAGTFLFDKGGVMTSAGRVPLRTYSEGGIAHRPQLAMFGEGSAPEAYVPVPSGRIPVNIRGGGGGNNQTVNMQINTPDANSFRRSQGQIAAKMGAELARQNKRNG